MVTHPDINPIQQGLTLVNGQELVFPFCDSHTINLTFSILIKHLCEVNPGHSHVIIIVIIIIIAFINGWSTHRSVNWPDDKSQPLPLLQGMQCFKRKQTIWVLLIQRHQHKFIYHQQKINTTTTMILIGHKHCMKYNCYRKLISLSCLQLLVLVVFFFLKLHFLIREQNQLSVLGIFLFSFPGGQLV